MENFKKEEISGKELSVFENLNYRHQELLNKLFELNDTLHHSTISLGGKYPLKENKITESPTDGSHINNYVNQLDYMENTLTYMFNHIEMLEHLVIK